MLIISVYIFQISPGMGCTGMHGDVWRHAAAKLAPGSFTPGVPASDTNATLCPFWSNAMISSLLLLCSWWLKSFFIGKLWWRKRDVVCLVSSAQTTSTCWSTFRAQMVISTKFPIGVATMYKCPGETTEEDDVVEEEYVATLPLRTLPRHAPLLLHRLCCRGRRNRVSVDALTKIMATRETRATLLLISAGVRNLKITCVLDDRISLLGSLALECIVWAVSF